MELPHYRYLPPAVTMILCWAQPTPYRIKGDMSKSIVVLGAGPVGLAAAMLLAGDGQEVVVFRKDSARVPASPAEAWDWDRRGVAQFRQALRCTQAPARSSSKSFPGYWRGWRRSAGIGTTTCARSQMPPSMTIAPATNATTR